MDAGNGTAADGGAPQQSAIPGVWQPRGRTWLALRRVGILGLSAALGTAFLMLTGLVTDSLLYGGLGDLSAAAQSSEIFQNFPYPLTPARCFGRIAC